MPREFVARVAMIAPRVATLAAALASLASLAAGGQRWPSCHSQQPSGTDHLTLENAFMAHTMARAPQASQPPATAGDAVLVEARRLIRLPALLLHFRENLPDHWVLTLLHGPTNAPDALHGESDVSPLRRHVRSGGVVLRPLPTHLHNAALKYSCAQRARAVAAGLANASDLCATPEEEAAAEATIVAARAGRRARRRMPGNFSAVVRMNKRHVIEHSVARRWYNAWLQTLEFWTLFRKPYLLLLEADVVLCPNPTIPLDWWAGKFAYVGAPWFHDVGMGSFACKQLRCCVGNSGFSLWNRARMERCVGCSSLPTLPQRTGHPCSHADPTSMSTCSPILSVCVCLPARAPRLVRANLFPPKRRPHMLLDKWASSGLQKLAADGKLRGLPAVPNEELAGAFGCGEPPEYWRGSHEYTPVGLHGVSNWRTTRLGDFSLPSDPVCPTNHSVPSVARRRCLRLLRECPAIEAIVLNTSLGGERGSPEGGPIYGWP